MDTREHKIMQTVDGLREDILDFTSRLVGEPSVLGREFGALRVAEEELSCLGLPVRRIPLAYTTLTDHPGFAPVHWPENDRYCLVSETAQEARGGRSALFNGHLDVVSPEPLEFWTREPFVPVVEDGWMYGRGSGDMKSGIAAMIYAAHAIRKAGFTLAAPLTLELVIEEECSGNGALACRAAGVDADAVLIPEPFGPRLYRSQVGVLWFKIRLTGRPVHVLQAGTGANALEKCFPLIAALRDLEGEMNEPPLPPPYDGSDHPLHLNIGILKGGAWPSTVAAEAQFHGRLSFFPGQRFDSVRDLVQERVFSAASADPWLRENPPVVEFYGFRSEGHVEHRSHPVLQTLDTCHQELTGSRAQEYVSTCTTDLRSFYSYGKARGCCYGPVAEDIHGTDERVRLDSVIHTARAYALFAARWCGLME
ncbi:MAG: ArgE/DapE family deacylase [Desulfovibrionales bacterium]